MTERRRQLWLQYRDTLGVAYVITVFMLPVVMLPASPRRDLLSLAILFAISGFLFGNCFFVLTQVRERIRLRSFLANLVAHTILMTLTVLVATGLDIWTVVCIFTRHWPFDPEVSRQLSGILKPDIVEATTIGGTLVAGMINGLFSIDRKLGPGILWSWITGKYYNPKEEERIFMFLDMKDSTSIAERLGSLRFSALVRDFFRDLTFPVLESRAEVSHYIGDEAVLTWKPADGIRDANCVQVFFRMRAALEARRESYVSSYGFLPEFKAGLHIGKVVATEVGEIKSEIVFHGDPLNTTARIQGLCNEEGQPLLVSGDLAKKLVLPASLEMRSIGIRHLKGRQAEIEVFAICPPNEDLP